VCAVAPVVTAPEWDRTSGTLVGTVLSPEGRPIVGARVLAGWRLQARAGDGRYRIEGLPPGRCEVGAAAPGHPPVQQEVRVEVGVETRLDFVLLPGGLPVAGVVTTADGRPLAGAQITISPERESDRAFGCVTHPRTGSDGRFRIEGVPGGTVRIRALAPFCRPGGQRVAAGRTDVLIALDAGGEIRGTVILPPGAPPSSRYRVSVLDPGGEEAASLHSDIQSEDCDDLTFTLRGLRPDPYGLEVTVPGVGLAVMNDVRVQAGRVTRVELRVAFGLALTGRVVTADAGVPVADALVVVMENRR